MPGGLRVCKMCNMPSKHISPKKLVPIMQQQMVSLHKLCEAHLDTTQTEPLGGNACNSSDTHCCVCYPFREGARLGKHRLTDDYYMYVNVMLQCRLSRHLTTSQVQGKYLLLA